VRRRCQLVAAALILVAQQSPASLGFQQFYKCPSDADTIRLGDPGTAANCLNECSARGGAGCWYLDGTGGFARDCRVCRTLAPAKFFYPNDWAMPIEADIS
jgi:hypothetical protein